MWGPRWGNLNTVFNIRKLEWWPHWLVWAVLSRVCMPMHAERDIACGKSVHLSVCPSRSHTGVGSKRMHISSNSFHHHHHHHHRGFLVCLLHLVGEWLIFSSATAVTEFQGELDPSTWVLNTRRWVRHKLPFISEAVRNRPTVTLEQ